MSESNNAINPYEINNIPSLYPDHFMYLMYFLDMKSLIAFSRTSRQLHEIALDQKLLLFILKKYFHYKHEINTPISLRSFAQIRQHNYADLSQASVLLFDVAKSGFCPADISQIKFSDFFAKDIHGKIPSDWSFFELEEYSGLNEFCKRKIDEYGSKKIEAPTEFVESETAKNILFCAVRLNLPLIITYLVRNGVNINAEKSFKNSTIYPITLSLGSNKDTIQTVLELGSSLRLETKEQRLTVVKYVMDPDTRENSFKEFLEANNMPVRVLEPDNPFLYNFLAKEEDKRILDVLQFLSSRYKEIEGILKEKFRELLHIAIINNSDETAKFLIEKASFDQLNELHIFFGSLLQDTICFNREDIFEFLISKGVDTNFIGKNGETALFTAAEYGRVNMFRRLCGLSKATIDTPNEDEKTPFLISAEKGHIEVCEELLNNGANILAIDCSSYNALLHAAGAGHVEVVNFLLKKEPELLNTVDRIEENALHIAVQNTKFFKPGHLSVAINLILRGINITAKNCEGNRPLDLLLKNQAENLEDTNDTFEFISKSTEDEIAERKLINESMIRVLNVANTLQKALNFLQSPVLSSFSGAVVAGRESTIAAFNEAIKTAWETSLSVKELNKNLVIPYIINFMIPNYSKQILATVKDLSYPELPQVLAESILKQQTTNVQKQLAMELLSIAKDKYTQENDLREAGNITESLKNITISQY